MKEARNLNNQSRRTSMSDSSHCPSWSSLKERQDKSELKGQEIVNCLNHIYSMTDSSSPARTNDKNHLCQGIIDGGGKVLESCFGRTNLGDDVDRWSVYIFSSPLYVVVYALCTVWTTKSEAGLKNSTTFFFVIQLLKAQKHSRV
jgi:hypothetical protein